MGRTRPWAYAQGDLDYLCGVYAVVNSVRCAITPLRPFSTKDCRCLFGAMISELARRWALRYSIVEGNASQDISRLLRTSAVFVAARYEIALRYRRPFHNRARVSRRILADAIDAHSRRPGSSVLIGFSYHWTVVRKVARNSFRLLDSGYLKAIRFDEFVIGLRERRKLDQYKLSPGWVYFIDASVAENRVSSRGRR